MTRNMVSREISQRPSNVATWITMWSQAITEISHTGSQDFGKQTRRIWRYMYTVISVKLLEYLYVYNLQESTPFDAWFIKGHNLFFVCMCSLHFTAACQPLNFVIYTTIVCMCICLSSFTIRHTVTQTLVLQMHIVICVEKKRKRKKICGTATLMTSKAKPTAHFLTRKYLKVPH